MLKKDLEVIKIIKFLIPVLKCWNIKIECPTLKFSPQFEYRPKKYVGLSVGGYAAVKTSEERKMRTGGWENTGDADFFKNGDVGLAFGLRAHVKNFAIFMLYKHGLKRCV